MDPALPPGSPLLVVSGKYKGLRGTIDAKGVTPQKVWVAGVAESPVCLSQQSVSSVSSLASALDNLDVNTSGATPTKSLPATPRRTSSRVLPQSPSFQLPGSPASLQASGVGMVIDKIVMRSVEKKSSDGNSFLAHWLGSERLQNVHLQLPLPDGMDAVASAKQSLGSFADKEWELVNAEMDEDKGGGGWQKQYIYKLRFAAVSGAGLPTICVRDELEKIACFEAQDSTVRKTAERLTLLSSNAARIIDLRADDFELIDDDPMNDGCGFIPDELMLKLLGGGQGSRNVGGLQSLRAIIDAEGLDEVKKHDGGASGRTLQDMAAEIEAARAERGVEAIDAVSEALRLVAVQVRAIGPKVGVSKGMLMRKPGITKIQLTPSMIKVGPSRRADAADWVALVVKLEMPFEAHRLMERVLKGDKLSTSQKKLLAEKVAFDKEMVPRLWTGLGVPQETIRAYRRKPLEQSSHAWLVGVADPIRTTTTTTPNDASDGLPPGHIFVTGLLPALLETGRREVFITRSPCIKRAAGRLLPTVLHKPEAMLHSHWEWLNALPFGAVIFSTAGEGPPLPERGMSGDLDGDLYLVCWDAAICESVRPVPLAPPAEQHIVSSVLLPEDKAPIHNDSTWLEQVQAAMMSNTAPQEQGLVGWLYNASAKHDDMSHPDAEAYADAYNQALERQKHGCAIQLPAHLLAKVPARLRAAAVDLT